MFDKEFCKKIGQLLKKADELQLYYYEAHDRLTVKDVPSELIGGKCLSMVITRPIDGINFLNKQANTFVRFCDSERKKQAKNWRIAYGRMDAFKKLFKEVFEKINGDKEKCYVDTSSKNTIMLEYFI